jgi:hypothetical protein
MPLKVVFNGGHLAVAELLLEQGAYTAARGVDTDYNIILNHLDFNGYSDLLHFSYKQCHDDMYFAQVNSRTRLHLAARGGEV